MPIGLESARTLNLLSVSVSGYAEVEKMPWPLPSGNAPRVRLFFAMGVIALAGIRALGNTQTVGLVQPEV